MHELDTLLGRLKSLFSELFLIKNKWLFQPPLVRQFSNKRLFSGCHGNSGILHNQRHFFQSRVSQ